MSNLGSFTDININGNYLTVKDKILTEIVEEIIMAIGANNGNISERINNLHERSFDAEIKITSNNDSEISNIIDGLYKLQYVTVTGEGDEAVETLDNSAILIQQGTDQYIYKDGEIIHKIKIDNKWWNSLKEYYTNQYLTIVSLEDNNEIKFKNDYNPTLTISVSTDNGQTWLEKTSSTDGTLLATLNNNDKILIKGNNENYGHYSTAHFTSSKNFNVQGNILSLIYEDNFANKTSLIFDSNSPDYDKTFKGLFINCTHLISAEHLVLPLLTLLGDECYSYMFNGCTSLTTAPELPATTLALRCYMYMFFGCSNLITPPKIYAQICANQCCTQMFGMCSSLIAMPNLPATTLGQNCYGYMFMNCTSLTTAPELPATTLAQNCYQSMFSGCSGLTTAPELPATTLAQYCYASMFYGCTSLTTAPELPATTSSPYCYNYMFSGCTSLTTAPELPATTLADNCYSGMFKNCTSLTIAPELPAITLATGCYSDMFQNCTSLTIAPELPATTLAQGCYYEMFYGCTSLTSAPNLPATILTDDCYYSMFTNCIKLVSSPELNSTYLRPGCYKTMFSGCQSLNYIKCLANGFFATTCTLSWAVGVQSTGVFIKNDSKDDWQTGTQGIPVGWQVYNESDYKEVRHYELSSVSGGVTSFNGQQGEITYTPPVISVNGHQGTITVNELPSTTSSDNGKILMVIDGAWTLVSPSTLYSGTGSPNNENGNNGDIYVQTGEQSNE